jgi:hypothetical protein
MVDRRCSHRILDIGPLVNGESSLLNVTKCQKPSEHMSKEYHYLSSLGIDLISTTNRTFGYDPL